MAKPKKNSFDAIIATGGDTITPLAVTYSHPFEELLANIGDRDLNIKVIKNLRGRWRATIELGLRSVSSVHNTPTEAFVAAAALVQDPRP
jgi:hypothetical protein